MRRDLDLLGDSRGFTVAEMLMAMAVFTIVFGTIIATIQVATHSQSKVSRHVIADQQARPVMTALIDRLHSSCVAPGIAPIQAGSTGSAISFVSKAGSAVSPTPDKRVVSLSGTTLTEQVYPATSGAPPSWTFSGTATSDRTLLTGVTAAKLGSPAVAVPVFRYYAYVGGQVSATPLAVPLSAADAAKTVQVEVAFAVGGGGSGAAVDPTEAIAISDSTTLRLEPASEDSAEVNLPCV
jgi:prepilin-type N-terminal cleavage/methylation domain-containing protein